MKVMKTKCIASYPKVFKPSTDKFGNTRYSIDGLIHKDDPQLKEIQAAIEEVKANGFPTGSPSKVSVLRDPKADYPDYYILSLTANEDSKPFVADMSGQPLGPSELYGGAEVWLHYNVFAYDKHGGGISTGLNGVIVTGQEGALGKFSGKPTKDQILAEIQEAATATGAPALTVSAELAAQGHTVETLMGNGQYTIEQLKEFGWVS